MGQGSKEKCRSICLHAQRDRKSYLTRQWLLWAVVGNLVHGVLRSCCLWLLSLRLLLWPYLEATKVNAYMTRNVYISGTLPPLFRLFFVDRPHHRFKSGNPLSYLLVPISLFRWPFASPLWVPSIHSTTNLSFIHSFIHASVHSLKLCSLSTESTLIYLLLSFAYTYFHSLILPFFTI